MPAGATARCGSSVNGARRRACSTPHGTSLGLARADRARRGWKAGAGLALYLPDQFLARVQLIPASEPHFILLDNDPHRAVHRAGRGGVATATASRSAPARRSSPTPSPSRSSFDVGVEAGEKVGEAALDIDAAGAGRADRRGAGPRRTRGCGPGAMFRGELSLDLTLDILSNVESPAWSPATCWSRSAPPTTSRRPRRSPASRSTSCPSSRSAPTPPGSTGRRSARASPT